MKKVIDKVGVKYHKKTSFKSSQTVRDRAAERKHNQIKRMTIEQKDKKRKYDRDYKRLNPQPKEWKKQYNAHYYEQNQEYLKERARVYSQGYRAMFKAHNETVTETFIQDFVKTHNLMRGSHVRYIPRAERQKIVDNMFADKTLFDNASDPYLRGKSIQDLANDPRLQI